MSNKPKTSKYWVQAEDAAKWYLVKELSYIGDRICSTDEVVQYSGEPGENLEEITAEEAERRLSGK